MRSSQRNAATTERLQRDGPQQSSFEQFSANRLGFGGHISFR
jgi:hypothetical protein